MSNKPGSKSQMSSVKQAFLLVEKMQKKLAAAEKRFNEPIAIVGIGCRFPGAKNIDEFWQLLKNGVDAIQDVPAERWNPDDYFDPQPNTPGKLYNRGGGFVADIDKFDPQFFGISPREAKKMDPQQRLLLEVMWEAFENAGIVPETLAGTKTGVFVGISNNDYSLIQDDDFTQIDAYTGTGNAFSISANRISYLLDLRGPSVALDTACSSSLVAVHLACQSLRAGESKLALAGGVNLILTPEATIIFSQAALMSATSHCNTFDASADGYVRSEGCGIVALKRLSDAERDGDNILAVIRGSAVNQDGRSNGITAPNGLAQQAVIQDALKNAGVKPEAIDYIETHGTGTILGDPIEVQSLGTVMKNRSKDAPCYIGSVKTNIGHLESAAGIAGLIKVALALKNQEIPKHINFKEINPHIPLEDYPLAIATEARSWTAEERFAGLSSFGFGGTNSHIVFGAAPVKNRAETEIERSRHLLCLSAKDPDVLKAHAQNFHTFLANSSEKLGDICFTATTGRTHFPFRLALTAEDKPELIQSLKDFLQGMPGPDTQEGLVAQGVTRKVAFLFTGQGAQYAGMGRELYATQPTFRKHLDQCAQILSNYLEKPLLDVIFNEEELLNETAYTQPALFAIEYSLAQLWLAWGVKPDFVLGHSVGEYVAACISGVFSLEDGLKLIAARGRLMQSLPHDGAMAVIFADEKTVRKALKEDTEQAGIAGVNGNSNIVVSGKKEVIQKITEKFTAEGVEIRNLTVSHAFHSALMDPILDEFEKIAREVAYQSPQIPIVSNLTGKILSGKEIPDAVYWRQHIREAVQFLGGMNLLAEQGCNVFIETGPHPVLLGMGRRCLPKHKAIWLPSLKRDQQDWQMLLESVGKMYVQGLRIDWHGFDADYTRKRVELPTYPFQRERYWIDNTKDKQRKKSRLQTQMNAEVHPFLGRQILSPLKTAQYEAMLSREWVARFTEFQLHGLTTLPALAFVEMALATQTGRNGNLSAREIKFAEPVLFPDEETQHLLQTLVEPAGDFRIYKFAEAEGWQILGSGQITAEKQTSPENQFDLSVVEQLKTKSSIPGEKFYQTRQKLGLRFDSVIKNLWHNETSVLAELELAPTTSTKFMIHPGILDACFQVMTVFLGDENSDFWLPQKLDLLTAKQHEQTQLLLYARQTTADAGLQGDVTVLDENGAVILELKGLTLQPLPDSLKALFEGVSAHPAESAAKSDELKELNLSQLASEPTETQVEILEKYLQREIAGVLGLAPKRVHIQVAVSNLGLDSIMAIELKNKIESKIGIDYPIANLLEGPSIHQIAEQLAEALKATLDTNRAKLESAAEPVTEFPLSQGQRAMWFQHQMAPESIFNLRYAVRIRNEIDIPALQQAFQRLIDRHSGLRTTFHSQRGEPVQRIHENMPVHFQQIDATAWKEAEFQRKLEDVANRGFDLENGPLFRVTLFQRGESDHVLLQTIHHIVADLWSQAIIAQEIGQLYRNAELTPLPLQYSDFVRWQREMLPGTEGNALWEYWQQKLAGDIPVLNLPTDRPRPAVQTFRGSMKTIKLPGKLSARLHEISEQQGTTLFMTLLAAFKVLLQRYSGQDDIIVGTPTTGRSHSDLAPIVGYFVNPLPLRSDMTGKPRFVDFLQQVRKTVVEAINHQDYPLALLVEKLQPRRDTSRTPLFQVMFILQRAHLLNEAGLSSFAIGNEANEMQLEGLSMQAVPLEERGAPFELTLMMAETDNGLAASLTYNTDLFDGTTIDRMLGQFNCLLESIVAQPTAVISQLSLLPEAEQIQVIQKFNDTRWPFPEDKCVHEIIEQKALELPEHLAVIFEEQKLTYRELNQRANQFAHLLRRQGVGPDVIVGICVERSPEMIVSMLAVVKAGGAYLPMDPDYPAERLALMVEDSQVPLLISQEKFAEKFAGQRTKLVLVEHEAEQLAQESTENLVNNTLPENLAYVIYTSGSTGRPKGTLLHHQGLVNFASAHFPALEMNQNDKMLQFASFSFDASVSEIFTALFAGATLVLARRETLLSSPKLIELLQTEKVSAAILPPSMLSVLPAGGLPDLRIIISAGENCTAEIVEKWSAGRHFFNGYGPTEATVGPTLHRVKKPSEKIPIGRPLANIQVYLLDAHLNPVPLGVPGELHLGGVCVARGYHNRPEMTAEKFIPDPFSPENGARLYKTGDLARYLPDGTLEFLGRIDHQVKVRGFRIEVGEIESVLAKHDLIKDVLVLAKADKAGMNRLIAYLVPNNGKQLEQGKLRNYLQERLPEYMVPSLFVPLEKFPLTPNGKVDRKALPEPSDGADVRQATYVKPGTELEQKLAEIWQEVLGLEKVGVHDNFFEIGGHSLAMVKVHAALCEYLEKEISVVEMFKYPTIQSLGHFLSTEEEKTPLFVEQQARAARQKQALQKQRQRMRNRRK